MWIMSDNIETDSTVFNWIKRSKIKRRQFTYTAYIPERRSGNDRRGESLERRNSYSEIRGYHPNQNQFNDDR